ncbi:CUB domain protein [Cooperia oncophora]
MRPFCSFSWTKNLLIIAAVLSQINADYDDDECDCPHQTYGEEYESGEIKRLTKPQDCGIEQCVIQVEPGRNTSLTLFLESITLNSQDRLQLSQYFVINETEIHSLYYVELGSTYRRSIFTAAVGVGFTIRYWFQTRMWYGSSSFTISFDRVGPDVKTCPFPLLRSSLAFTNVPSIERLGPLRCPFRIVPSVPGRKILMNFNKMRGTNFYEKQENYNLRMVPPETKKFHSTMDSVDFVLESLSPLYLPRYNITYKELAEDPCFCDKNDVVVGSTPVYITSPGFPDIYCSNFRCRKRFVHNDTLLHDSELTFVVNVHYLSTEKSDYIEFYSDGTKMERLNGSREDVRLVLTGDVMETEFVTDKTIVQHGYNMTVESTRIPTDCLCPHKGVKTMLSKGSVRMDIPEYCTVVYCKWSIPTLLYTLKFAALFNFTSEFDMLTVAAGNDVRQQCLIFPDFRLSLGKLSRRQWEMLGNSPPVTILYERAVQANSSLPSAMTSFVVSWMPNEGCSCNNGSEKGAVVGEWTELTSPDYPLSYCNDMLCVTRIIAPEGHHVVLNITDFYTEPYNDVLALFDGTNITGRHMDVFHGKKRFPYLIRNTNETLTLVFKSDHDVSYHGYRLLFSAEPNDEDHPDGFHSPTHYATFVIILLSIMLITAIVLAVFRRFPLRFENPLYSTVRYSEQAE